MEGTIQVPQCCSKSHPISGNCDKASAFTSEALKMWVFSLDGKEGCS